MSGIDRGAPRAMTDIVDRLRNVSILEWCEPMCIEAANEIERLRAERDEAIATLTLYRAQNGCTRGQRTTQWCGEAARLIAVIDERDEARAAIARAADATMQLSNR